MPSWVFSPFSYCYVFPYFFSIDLKEFLIDSGYELFINNSEWLNVALSSPPTTSSSFSRVIGYILKIQSNIHVHSTFSCETLFGIFMICHFCSEDNSRWWLNFKRSLFMVYINRKIQNLISNFPKELHRGFLPEMCKMSKEEGMRNMMIMVFINIA